jgi:hypothetical protein
MCSPSKPQTCHKSLTNFITWCCIEYTFPWAGFECTTLLVTGTHCTGDCKLNYHMITIITAPLVQSHKTSKVMLVNRFF